MFSGHQLGAYEHSIVRVKNSLRRVKIGEEVVEVICEIEGNTDEMTANVDYRILTTISEMFYHLAQKKR